MLQALLHSKLSDREAELEAQRRDMALSFDSASRQVGSPTGPTHGRSALGPTIAPIDNPKDVGRRVPARTLQQSRYAAAVGACAVH